MAKNLNPNHPVSIAMENQYHKIVAILMMKQNLRKCIITIQDIELLANSPIPNNMYRCKK